MEDCRVASVSSVSALPRKSADYLDRIPSTYRRDRDPVIFLTMLSVHIFKDITVAGAMVATLLSGMTFFVNLYFVRILSACDTNHR